MTTTLTAAPADEPRREHPTQEDEFLRRARAPKPLTTIIRRDVRTVIARQRGW
ncbi:hypothetical protein ACIOEX_01425 [Streptomyces sp. NPDC087850]|uniref:hypothetical protein n=1 Tax=Streptomyces sp. NPDC087850 TaxID=3365809 RepID=UPI00380A5F35